MPLSFFLKIYFWKCGNFFTSTSKCLKQNVRLFAQLTTLTTNDKAMFFYMSTNKKKEQLAVFLKLLSQLLRKMLTKCCWILFCQQTIRHKVFLGGGLNADFDVTKQPQGLQYRKLLTLWDNITFIIVMTNFITI